ncbi:MAG TPA: phosphatidylglycerophosphatase A [Bacteroidetes bacterium]|nr:phosphatidylglycerophosphatase A [Bacteroidota bacterium]
MTSPAEQQSQNSAPAGQAIPGASTLSILVRAFASGLFSGYSPVASGTVGTAVGLAIYMIPGFEHPYVIIPACFFVLILGVKAADAMETVYGHDPAEVTIDEVLGMWVSLFLLPKSFIVVTVAFFLFRIMDIVKPFPARKFDEAKGGFGIMFDDVIAGVYTNLGLQLLIALGIIH